MKAHFYELEVVSKNLKGEVVKKEDVLFFHLERPSIADSNAQPYVYDGEATDRHKRDYKAEYKEFLDSKEPPPPAVLEPISVPSITPKVK